MSYRDDLEALTQRCNALSQQANATQHELDEARRLLADAQARRRLPVLDNLHIAAPCDASWADMRGDERTRLCASCDKHVYNLSEMTRAEAEALLIAKEGKLCVRYYQRKDGTILTADCPTGVRRRRRRRRVVAAAFGAASALAAAASVLHRGPPMMTMGAIAPPPQASPPPAPPELPADVVHKMGDVSAPVPLMGSVSVSAPVAPRTKIGKARIDHRKVEHDQQR